MAERCSVPNCDKSAVIRGWCRTHYSRWRRHGDPTQLAERERWLEPGERFTHLVVQAFAGKRGDHRTYLCSCDCGGETVVTAKALKGGHTRSCGCLRIERSPRRTHGLTSHPLYTCWYKMRQRCEDPKCEDYPNYGGRGIYVDVRWRDLRQFVADMHPKPGPAYLLDRVDNDGPYSPENCRWATPKESEANKRPHSTAMRTLWRERAIKAAEEAILEYAGDEQERKWHERFDSHELAAVVVDAVFAARPIARRTRSATSP